MAMIDTGFPNYIKYTDPTRVPPNYPPNYSYRDEFQETVFDISRRLPLNFLYKTASSGTISTTEVQILSGYTFPFLFSGPAPSEGMSAYAHINFSAICASIETTATYMSGYVRAEAFIAGASVAYSASEKAWISGTYQSTLNLRMSTKINPNSVMTLKFYTAAIATTTRYKLFESRYLVTEQLPCNVTLTFSYQNTI